MKAIAKSGQRANEGSYHCAYCLSTVETKSNERLHDCPYCGSSEFFRN